MIHLTDQEKKVLLFAGAALSVGLLLEGSLKIFPKASRYLTAVADDFFYPRLNVNRATFEELVSLPQVGPTQARRIITARKSGGDFRSAADLGRAGITEAGQKRLAKYLLFW